MPYWHAILIFFAFMAGVYLSQGNINSDAFYTGLSTAVIWLILSYITNAQRSVISVSNGNITFGSKGTVHGNIKSEEIIEIINNYTSSNPHIYIRTKDDSRFLIPVAGFSKREVEKIISTIMQ